MQFDNQSLNPPNGDSENASLENTNELKEDFTLPNTTQIHDSLLNEQNQEIFLDSSGTAFDPTIHISRDKLTKDGRFKKKTGGYAGVVGGIKHTKSEASITGEGYAQFYSTLHVAIWGQSGRDENLEKALAISIQRYLREEGLSDIPAKIELPISMALYTTTVAMKEENREKTFSFLGKIKKWFVRKKRDD